MTHLREAYRRLSRRLEQDGRLTWVAEEVAILNNPDTYRTDPETAWGKAAAALQQSTVSLHLERGCRVAGEGGTACQHSPPAVGEGRGFAGNRRDRAD